MALVKIESYEVLSEHPHMMLPTALALKLENGAQFLMGSIPVYIGAELMRIEQGVSQKNEFYLVREINMHDLLEKNVEVEIKTKKSDELPITTFGGSEKIFGKEPKIVSLGPISLATAYVKVGKIKAELSGVSGVLAAAMLSAKLKYNGKVVKNIAALAKGSIPLIALDAGTKHTPIFFGIDPHQMVFLGGYDFKKLDYKPLVADRHSIESFIHMMKKKKAKLKEIRISGLTAQGIYVGEAILEKGSVSFPIIPSNALLLKEIFSVPGYVDDTLVKIQEKAGN